jgi:hypothetical protein
MKTEHWENREQGSALILAMVITVLVMGLVVALAVLTQDSARKSGEQAITAEALEAAEINISKAIMKSQATAVQEVDGEWVGLVGQNDDDTPGSCILFDNTVRIKSAYLSGVAGAGFLREITKADREDPNNPLFDIYEISSASGLMGEYDYNRGVQAVVEIRKEVDIAVPSTLYLHGDSDPAWEGSAWLVSGADHAMEPAAAAAAAGEEAAPAEEENQAAAALVIPQAGRLKVTYLLSNAGLCSGFFMEGEDGPIEIFAENRAMDQNTTVERIYNAGDRLNFFIRTYGSAWGIGDYDHYAVGQTDSFTGKPFCIITQINDTKWRYEFEDLPGRYYCWGGWQNADWDYDDEVVEIELIPPTENETVEGDSPAGGDPVTTELTEADYRTGPGIWATGYNLGEWVDLGVADSQNEQSHTVRVQNGADLYGADSFIKNTRDPRTLAATLLGCANATPLDPTANNVVRLEGRLEDFAGLLGSKDNFQVTYLKVSAAATGGEGGDGGAPNNDATGVVSGELNVNPNNNDAMEFYLVKPDGSRITRDDLHDGFDGYTGPATAIHVKPKGNGNQNTIAVDGQVYPLHNRNVYDITGTMTVNLYHATNGNGHAMGQWWIATTGNGVTINESGDAEAPAEEAAAETPAVEGAGLLVIEGDVTFPADFKYYGMVIVLGNATMNPDAAVAELPVDETAEEEETPPADESPAAITVPVKGKLKFTYLGSSAGLQSGFWMSNPVEEEIFARSNNSQQQLTVEREYNPGQKLNFFIRTYADSWGLGTYDHYSVGQTDDYANKAYCVVTELVAGRKWKLEFEDLPGRYRRNNKWNYADWDYNDQVVEVELIETVEGASPDLPRSHTVGGQCNINPSNNSDFEFSLVTPTGIISRDELHDRFGGYTGAATLVRVKPKGNGNQNSLTLDGELFILQNSKVYTIESQSMTVRLYNDHVNNGRAMGRWWIEINATGATHPSGEEPAPEEAAPAATMRNMLVLGQVLVEKESVVGGKTNIWYCSDAINRALLCAGVNVVDHVKLRAVPMVWRGLDKPTVDGMGLTGSNTQEPQVQEIIDE